MSFASDFVVLVVDSSLIRRIVTEPMPKPVFLLICTSLSTIAVLAAAPGTLPKIDFNEQIRPILNKNCTSCHGGVKQAGEVSFVYREQALGKGESGEPVIVPGDPAASELVRRITTDDSDDRMPPPDEHPEGLSSEEIKLLTTWIAEGAEWGEHWSFVQPEARPLPKVSTPAWPRESLDHFVLARLDAEELTPTQAATPTEWLRRATFDLTGLPPTRAEQEAFARAVNTNPEGAYPAAVDRLLSSPGYGERWATLWLDLARYADTMGFEKDLHRNVWPYRDWLIRAFNADLPFDEFTIKQLAGDLLPDPTPSDLIATIFHRNTMTNTEGGTDDEEFRVAAVIDRINTTWTVWQGSTFGCVQCHNHPYDPFKQEEYYRFMAFFNNTEDCDLGSEFPSFELPSDPAHARRALKLDRENRRLRARLNSSGRKLASELTDWINLEPNNLTSSHGTLTIGSDQHIRVAGTIPTKAHYTLTTPAVSFQALRVEIFPESDQATDWPERGSVLSKLDLALTLPDGTVQAIPLREVFADHLAGPYDATDSLHKGASGFGGYPKLFGPRWAVFVPEAPVLPPSGAQLTLTLHQQASTTGGQATPLRRFALAISNDSRWNALVHDPARAELRSTLRKQQKERSAFKGASIPVVRERPVDGPRPTRLFIRGNWLDHGDLLAPGVPAVLPPLPATNPSRLDLAHWIMAPENPLTGRVLVNRLWAELFGIGLVETLEDFGSTGTRPSHPHLLDHLALRLQNHHHWRLQAFLRELVLSATYRQANRAAPALRARDPHNRLLARGPATRLSAEMIRDQALTASGLLHRQQFGPAVMPPQPDGIWQTVYNGSNWKTATGPDRYRRALYTYWRRTSPYPSFLTFDAPSREVCTPRRIVTNTPLQALVTLNDPVYLECAQALAKRMNAEGGPTVHDQIAWALKLVASQLPRTNEVDILLALHRDATTEFTSSLGQSKALADSPSQAALVLVANTILNLDAALTK